MMTQKQRALRMLRIKDAPFTTRTRNCLVNCLGENATVQELTENTPEQLVTIPNFGVKSLIEIMDWLANYKLKLRDPKTTTTDTASIGRIAK